MNGNLSRDERERRDYDSLTSWLDEHTSRLRHARLYTQDEFDPEYEVRDYVFHIKAVKVKKKLKNLPKKIETAFTVEIIHN